MIYTITLTNKKTGQEVSRKMDLDPSFDGDEEMGRIIFSMRDIVEESKDNKF